ncbi:MAG: chlorosome protein C [Chloroherpetonaceae bacterium]
MTETYQKLREEFKAMPLPERLGFLAEAAVLTGQSAIVGTLNLIGDIVEGATSTVENISKNLGISGESANTAAQTVNRVVITVKDAGKAAGAVVKDVAKSVDSATEGIVKTAGEAAASATKMAAEAASAVSKTVSDLAKGGAKAEPVTPVEVKKEEPKKQEPKKA